MFPWPTWKNKEAAAWSNLEKAVRNNNVQKARKILRENKVDINKRNTQKYTLLHLALINSGFAMVQLLLQQEGIKVNAAMPNKETPLLYAVKSGMKEIVGLLLKQKGIDIDKTNKRGKTALHIAALNDNDDVYREIFKMLVLAGADTQIKDKKGKLPYDWQEVGGEQTKCGICLENFEDAMQDPENKIVKLRCGHMFHRKCVEPWLKKKQTCPLCRTPHTGIFRKPIALKL